MPTPNRGSHNLGRAFKEAPLVDKAYLLLTLPALPAGVILALLGATGHHHALLIVGIVLIGVAVLDMMVVMPARAARRDVRRRKSN
jgi:hypothetical protein